MKIAAFDLGANIGIAHDTFGDTMSEHWLFKGHRTVRLAQFQERLQEFLRGSFLDVVVYERPFARGLDATRSLWGIAGILEATATNAGYPVMSYAPSEIKLHATGSGKADKGQMIAAARGFGYIGDNEHEADAWLLHRMARATLVKDT